MCLVAYLQYHMVPSHSQNSFNRQSCLPNLIKISAEILTMHLYCCPRNLQKIWSMLNLPLCLPHMTLLFWITCWLVVWKFHPHLLPVSNCSDIIESNCIHYAALSGGCQNWPLANQSWPCQAVLHDTIHWCINLLSVHSLLKRGIVSLLHMCVKMLSIKTVLSIVRLRRIVDCWLWTYDMHTENGNNVLQVVLVSRPRSSATPNRGELSKYLSDSRLLWLVLHCPMVSSSRTP